MNQEQTLKDILETVQFLKDNMVSIDVFEERIAEVKSDMIEHVDGFVALYQKHEVELAAVVHRQERLEEKLNKVIRHLGLQV